MACLLLFILQVFKTPALVGPGHHDGQTDRPGGALVGELRVGLQQQGALGGEGHRGLAFDEDFAGTNLGKRLCVCVYSYEWFRTRDTGNVSWQSFLEPK